MKRACYGKADGPLVTPEEFVQRATPLYKEHGVFPYCPACGGVVEIYGLHSPNVASRFDHKNLELNADPLDDCLLADRNTRFHGFEPDGWDEEAGRRLRRAFFNEENLRQAYAFCLHMCRKGNLPIKKFRNMIRRADKKKIWWYADIKLWVVPYILLSLENFTYTPKADGSGYEFHFILDKPRGTTASALWRRARDCRLKKVFSDSGSPVKADDNPFPLSERALREKAGDTAWITGNFLQALKACE